MSDQEKHHAGKDSLDAMRENDAHTTGQNDAVPGTGNAHAHSHAAHEAGGKPNTKPAEGEGKLIAREEVNLRIDRGHDNNRGAGAGLRGNSGTRGQ